MSSQESPIVEHASSSSGVADAADEFVPSPQHAGNAWAWGLGAGLGHGQPAGGRSDGHTRYVSPFVSSHVLPASEREQEDADAGEMLAFRGVPPPIETAHRLGASSSTDVSGSATSAGVTPRSALTPIGTRALAPIRRKGSMPEVDHSHLVDKLDASLAGVTLSIQDDVVSAGVPGAHSLRPSHSATRFESKSGSEASSGAASDFLNSPFSTTLTSLTASPLSTPNFPSQLHTASGQQSPHSPDLNPYSSHHFSAPPSRNHSQTFNSSAGSSLNSSSADAFDAGTDKSLAHIFSNSNAYQQGVAAMSVSAHQSPQTYTLLPTLHSQQQQQRQSPPQSFQSTPAAGAAQVPLPTVPTGTGDVAYVVLPNGQVQAIPMATLQQHLQPNGSSASPATRGAPSTQQAQQVSPQQHYQPASTYSSSQYDTPPSDGDSFSLATLSTQTLPLYTSSSPAPPALPPVHTQHISPALRANTPAYQQPQQQQSSPLLHHTQPSHASRLPPSGYAPPRRDSPQHLLDHSNNTLQPPSSNHSIVSGHSPNPSPTSPLSPSGLAGPGVQQQQRPGSGTNMSVEHARELVRQLSLQMAPNSHPQQPLSQQQQQPQQRDSYSHHSSGPSYSYHGQSSAHGGMLSLGGGPGLLNSGHGVEGMVSLAKSQAGSRLLQTKLGQNDPVYFTSVFDEVYEALPELMVDLFGNYLVQKLITFANDTQRLQMLLKVLPELLEISCDRQGTRAIQKLIDSLRHPSERQLVLEWLAMPMQPGVPQHPPQPALLTPLGMDPRGSSGRDGHLSPHLLHAPSPHASPSPAPSPPAGPSPAPTSPTSAPATGVNSAPPTALQVGGVNHPPMPRLIHLIRDSNGSHVVHAILDSFPPNLLYGIHCNAVHHCRSLGIDQHGLCVLKKCLSMCPLPDFVVFCKRFILDHSLEFVNNQYGNYLIQHILERTNAPANQVGANSSSGSSGSSNASGATGASTSSTTSGSTASQSGSGGDSPNTNTTDAAEEAARAALPSINELLFARLRGHFARLSRQKFSSNVVEKCLKIPMTPIRSAIVAELIESDSVASLLLCSYGNYVLQNVLYVASQEECALLFARVRPEHVLSSLRKNIRMKWERLLANAHLIHPGLTNMNVNSLNSSQQQQQQQHQQQLQQGGPSMSHHNHHLHVDVISPNVSPSGGAFNTHHRIVDRDPQRDRDQHQQQRERDRDARERIEQQRERDRDDQGPGATVYPSNSAIQLITSILGANTPGGAGTGGALYESSAGGPGGDRGGVQSGLSSPMQLSPAIRSVGSPMLGGGTRYIGGDRNSSRSGMPTYKTDNRGRGPMGSHSNVGSAVNSPYHTGSSGPSPSFAPHRGNGHFSATSSPYAGPGSSHHYGGGGGGNAYGGGHDSYQQSGPYRGGSAPPTPNYPASTNYNTNTGKYGSSSSYGDRGGHPQPPMHISSSRLQQHSAPAPSSSAPQTIEQQIQAHQAQLQHLMAMQAQQQSTQQPTPQYSVTILPSTSSAYGGAQQSRGGNRGSSSQPASPPLGHAQAPSSQQQQQQHYSNY